MSHYLIEVSYTSEAWSSQIDSQADVVERITPAVKAAHGTIETMYYAFGGRDLIGIIDFPKPEDAVAFGLVVSSSGALSSYKTTPLLTVAQGKASMSQAAQIRGAYSPPVTVDLVGKRAAVAAK
jgi:uncharacterized protein with GYD domain